VFLPVFVIEHFRIWCCLYFFLLPIISSFYKNLYVTITFCLNFLVGGRWFGIVGCGWLIVWCAFVCGGWLPFCCFSFGSNFFSPFFSARVNVAVLCALVIEHCEKFVVSIQQLRAQDCPFSDLTSVCCCNLHFTLLPS
jgi:hypothetical protein